MTKTTSKLFDKWFKYWFDENWKDWKTEAEDTKVQIAEQLEEQGWPYGLEQAFEAGWKAKRDKP